MSLGAGFQLRLQDVAGKQQKKIVLLQSRRCDLVALLAVKGGQILQPSGHRKVPASVGWIMFSQRMAWAWTLGSVAEGFMLLCQLLRGKASPMNEMGFPLSAHTPLYLPLL